MRLTILLVAVLVLFAACTASETTTDDEKNKIPSEDETGTAEELLAEPEDEPKNSLNPMKELESLFELQGRLEYMVVYDMTTDHDMGSTSGTMKQYIKGDRMRMDFIADGAESRTYISEESFITCTRDGEWMCFELETGGDDDSSFNPSEFRDDFESEEEEFDVRLGTPRTIAGKLATCFILKTSDSTTEYCLSKEAVPLYIKSEAEGYFSEMEATEYSTSVSNGDFQPPAEPTDFADMMGGFDPSAYS